MRLRRDELEAALETEHKRADLNAIALSLLIADKDVTTVRGKQGYTIRVIGPKRCDGGYVIVTWAPRGQHPHSAAYYLEEWVSSVTARHDIPLTKGYELEHELRALAFQVRSIAWEAVRQAS